MNVRRMVVSGMFGVGLTAAACIGASGVAGATTAPPGYSQAPGYGQANSNGQCHGVFGDYFGGLNSTAKSGQSANAPLGNSVGSVGSANRDHGCPSGA
ncbi:MAG TPA: hypothetical protein VMW49_06085 [Candidatus Dormibacteraeota bacterium]|nr:hypothetical protein [Candidatus Dormibacteraeota bacterium]